MNPTERMMMHLLDCALRGGTPEEAPLDGVNWAELFALAKAHKIDGLLLDPVCLLPEGRRPPADVMAAWQESAMLTMMGQALVVEQLMALLDAFEAAGVRAVVLKGIALKLLYPQPDLRTMSDADLLVSEHAFDAGCAVMEAEGYALLETEPGVHIFGGPDGLRVELHARLFDKTAYGFLSRLNEDAMFPLSLARRAPVYGGEAWVFPPKEHALFMLCHMAKHMITTGFGLRQTADFVLFAIAHDEAMDWDAFWREADVLGLRPFASAVLSLGMAHLSAPSGRFAQGMARDGAAAEGLLLDLLDAGVFGTRTEGRQRSAAVVYRAFEAENADAGRLRRALFPSAKTLKAPYLYARKSPALLPVAWVHRWAIYALRLLTGREKRADAAAGLQIADERLLLLGRLGLRDDKPGDESIHSPIL